MRVVHNSPSMASPASFAFPFPLSCLFFPPPSNPFPTPSPPFPTPPFPSLSCPSLVTLPPTLLPFSFSFPLPPPPLLPPTPFHYPIFFLAIVATSPSIFLFFFFFAIVSMSPLHQTSLNQHLFLLSINEI